MYTELLKTVWHSLYDPQKDTVKTIEKYFHPDYQQSINGVVLNRKEYIDHVLEQKNSMTIDVIDYQQILEKGNELFALYYPNGKNSNHLPIKAEVIDYFQFEQQQILKIHGLVRLLEGDPADVDMK